MLRFRGPSAETEQITARNCVMFNGIKAMNSILVLSRSVEGTLKSNAWNAIRGDFCWHPANQTQYQRNQNWKFKKHWFAQSQEKAQLNPVEQQDSATLLLKSSKSLLQMHETENYCKQTWEIKSDISKYWTICVLQLFVNQALTS